MFGLVPLMPAYGRDYETLEDAQADFDNNKDFRTPSGPVTNKYDLERMHPDMENIRVRFNNLTDTGMLRIKEGERDD
jgi:hypothetical protein